LDDASHAAIWTAYLEAKRALEGVTLADGGSMNDGVWSPTTPEIPSDTQLYVFVVGYNQGDLVAQSDLVPFTVGMAWPKPGDACDGRAGDFCPGTSLLCASGSCRTPCVSDDDCIPTSCDLPGLHGVAARLCSL